MNWQTINGWMSWIALGRVRNSFLSKALTAFSLAAFVLANAAPKLEEAGMDMQSAHFVFWGGFVFLAGYLAFAVLAPIEVRRAGEIDEIVGWMGGLADWNFFQSRVLLATNLLQSMQGSVYFNPPEGAMMFLRQQIGIAKKLKSSDPWEDSAKSLYHADLNLRQYRRPIYRMVVALLLAIGALTVIYPTLKNIILALIRS
jgi:hypothetical protein